MNIVIDNLTVSYQSRPAVHHVDMTFPSGCMYAIFGPNGAGKSTLLKQILWLVATQHRRGALAKSATQRLGVFAATVRCR